jgi:hypothetical protein
MTSRGAEPGSFALASPPPKFIEKTGRGSTKSVPIFEPVAPRASLGAGWHGFVLDAKSRFRIAAGEKGRHVEFVKGARVGAAGRFWVNRAGAITSVECASADYPMPVPDEFNCQVHYVLDAFRNSPDFRLAPDAKFRFTRSDRTRFDVSAEGERIEPPPTLRLVDRPRGSDLRPDADPPPLDGQSPGGEEGDGLGQRFAL